MVHKENVFLSDFLVNKYDDICLLLFFWHDPYRSRFESDLGKQGDWAARSTKVHELWLTRLMSGSRPALSLTFSSLWSTLVVGMFLSPVYVSAIGGFVTVGGMLRAESYQLCNIWPGFTSIEFCFPS